MLNTLREDGQPAEMGWPYLPATPNDPAQHWVRKCEGLRWISAK
jgi:hypothetical protein